MQALILKINNVTVKKTFYEIYCCRNVEWRGRIWRLYYVYLPAILIQERNYVTILFHHKDVNIIPFGLAVLLCERSI